MSSWNKKNKLKLKLFYTMDKYREDAGLEVQEIEGEMTYVNMPFASTFVNIETNEGKYVSISRDCILRIDWINLPKWTLLTEQQVTDSAKVRLLNLTNELEIQKNTYEQEKKLDEAIKEGNTPEHG